MPKTLIASFPDSKRIPALDNSSVLNIAECFMDTIQGENFVGIPSTFLRLQHCTLNCVWCDTAEVWRKGNPYSVLELVKIFEDSGLIEKMKAGQHLILTGGSPMLQEEALIELIITISAKHNFFPFVEIENECTRMPSPEMMMYVTRWNNSPKTENSGMKKDIRYKPEIIKTLSGLKDSWFKFVVAKLEDWNEIEEDFLKPGLIRKEQIVLMPEGQTREELRESYDAVVELAVRENVRMTDRMHVTIWNKKTGV
jgi:7-carboxy-7-deazaguanine synthase